MYTSDQIPLVIAATARFSSSVTDPKAAIITTANFFLGQVGETLISYAQTLIVVRSRVLQNFCSMTDPRLQTEFSTTSWR